MKEKQLYEWIRLILIEAGYEEQKFIGKWLFVKFSPNYDFAHEDEINNWIKENHLKNNI